MSPVLKRFSLTPSKTKTKDQHSQIVTMANLTKPSSKSSREQAPDSFASWQAEFLGGFCKTRTGILKASPELKMTPSPDLNKTPSEQGRSRLLDLPAELRIMVYRQLFLSYSSITIASPPTIIPHLGKEMALLRTCKELNAEVRAFIADHYKNKSASSWEEATADVPTSTGQHKFGMVAHMELLITELRPGNSSFVLSPWVPLLKELRTQAPVLRSLIIRRGDTRPTAVGLLDAIGDPAALKARKKETKQFLAAICKIKQLRTLSIHARVGSAGLAWLRRNLSKGVTLDNSRQC